MLNHASTLPPTFLRSNICIEASISVRVVLPPQLLVSTALPFVNIQPMCRCLQSPSICHMHSCWYDICCSTITPLSCPWPTLYKSHSSHTQYLHNSFPLENPWLLLYLSWNDVILKVFLSRFSFTHIVKIKELFPI